MCGDQNSIEITNTYSSTMVKETERQSVDAKEVVNPTMPVVIPFSRDLCLALAALLTTSKFGDCRKSGGLVLRVKKHLQEATSSDFEACALQLHLLVLAALGYTSQSNEHIACVLLDVLQKSRDDYTADEVQVDVNVDFSHLTDFAFVLDENVWTSEADIKADPRGVVVDRAYVDFCVSCQGRFDSYLMAMLLAAMKAAGMTTAVSTTALFCKSWTFVENRCAHAFRVYQNCKGHHQFRHEKIQWYRALFTSSNTHGMIDCMQDLEIDLWYANFQKDSPQREAIFDLLVALMGHSDPMVQSRAIVLFNCFVDYHDWQVMVPFVPRISYIGDEFQIEVLLPRGVDVHDILLVLQAPAGSAHSQACAYSYHNLEWEATSSGHRGRCSLGSFSKCGFYDYRLIRGDEELGSWETVRTTLHTMRKQSSDSLFPHLKDRMSKFVADYHSTVAHILGGDLSQTIPVQGRVIVHNAALRTGTFHELFPDAHQADVDYKKKTFIHRGSFSSVTSMLPGLAKRGVSVLYLMGALERDNGESNFSNHGGIEFQRPNSSPFAVTDRAAPCSMLGDSGDVRDLANKARSYGIEVVVDGLCRISSSQCHRKYRPEHFVHTIDAKGRKVPLCGGLGRSVHLEDTSMLNYRKGAVWRLTAQDLSRWVADFGVSGIHFENASLEPMLFARDSNELHRWDGDGIDHYTAEEQLQGVVCGGFDNKQSGYWTSEVSNHWPNPFFAVLTRELWKHNPTALFLGEVNDCTKIQGVSKSGLLPKVTGLLEGVGAIAGRKLDNGGSVSKLAPSALPLSSYILSCRKSTLQGGIVVTASASPSDPLPGLFLGRAAWPFVNLLFWLPTVPGTLLGEQEGKVYRLDGAAHFDVVTDESKPDAFLTSNRSRVRKLNSSSTLVHMSRTKSTVSAISDAETSEVHVDTSPSAHAKVSCKSSGSSPFCIVKNAADTVVPSLTALEEQFRKCLGPDLGFDIREIGKHYDHCREVRNVLPRSPESVLLPMKSAPGTFVFANVTSVCSFYLVFLNFTDQEVNVTVSMTAFQDLFLAMGARTDAVLKQTSPSPPGPSQMWRIGEVLAEEMTRKLVPFGAAVTVFSRVEEDIPFSELLQDALKRLGSKARDARNYFSNNTEGELPASLCKSVVSNAFISALINAVVEEKDLEQLVGVLQVYASAMEVSFTDGSLPSNLSTTLLDLLTDVGLFSRRFDSSICPVRGPKLGSLLMAKLNALAAPPAEGGSPKSMIPMLAQQIVDRSRMGPIVFVTTELGKWSTVGGLGVMVDELTTTLASELGQEIWVISPYYDRNRKGEQGYLVKDDIHYKFNVNVRIGSEDVTLGVHDGYVNNVRLLFMHNQRFFPHPYPDNAPEDAVRFLVAVAKGALETICQVHSKDESPMPQVIVSNDWPTGLIPAYGKSHFGGLFNDTTFFHIVHNMNPAYEGRIYASSDLAHIHGLDRNLLVDPNWNSPVINPCRCVLLTTDQWGTVSFSYRDELRGSNGKPAASPLSPLLNRYSNPFAFPNGIPVQPRLDKLRQAGFVEHSDAKAYLQTKFFGFQTPDHDIPLFAFIGRITSQKGVHLILEGCENLFHRYNFRIQVLVGGMVNWKDPYSKRCGNLMQNLRARFPFCFWADPDAFFVDGPAVNLGADFALMPSMFEPGGIVQHEFFVASTPVIAFKTGGLADSVFEFREDSGVGCGFTFESYNLGDYLYAVERSLRVFKNKQAYALLRENAANAVMASEVVARAWLEEFCRLRRKLPYNNTEISKLMTGLPKVCASLWDSEDVRVEVTPLQSARGPERAEAYPVEVASTKLARIRYSPPVDRPKPRVVTVAGSFDDWQVRRALTWEPSQNCFVLPLAVPAGEYLYKLIVDGTWICNPRDRTVRDKLGVENSVLEVPADP